MENKEAERESLSHPIGWPVGPTDEARLLNIKDRKNVSYIGYQRKLVTKN